MSVMRTYLQLIETAHAESVAHLFHWTSITKAITALRRDCLQARRWAHYLEGQGRMVKGSSWSLDPWKWSRDEPICFVLQRALLPNPVHSINGNRVFLQTKGMFDPIYDPSAYKFESTEPDEEFVEGTIKPLTTCLKEVCARHLSKDILGEIQALTALHGIPLRLLI